MYRTKTFAPKLNSLTQRLFSTQVGFTQVIFPHQIPCAHQDLHQLQQVNHETHFRIYTQSIVSMGPTDINLDTITMSCTLNSTAHSLCHSIPCALRIYMSSSTNNTKQVQPVIDWYIKSTKCKQKLGACNKIKPMKVLN